MDTHTAPGPGLSCDEFVLISAQISPPRGRLPLLSPIKSLLPPQAQQGSSGTQIGFKHNPQASIVACCKVSTFVILPPTQLCCNSNQSSIVDHSYRKFTTAEEEEEEEEVHSKCDACRSHKSLRRCTAVRCTCAIAEAGAQGGACTQSAYASSCIPCHPLWQTSSLL